MSPKQLNQNQTVSVRSSFEKKYPTSEHHVNGIDLRRLNIYPPAEVALNILSDDQCSRCATIQSAELRFLFNARWISSLIGWLGFSICAAFCRSEPVEETELDEH